MTSLLSKSILKTIKPHVNKLTPTFLMKLLNLKMEDWEFFYPKFEYIFLCSLTHSFIGTS